ncbi:hypothetical protein V1477_011972 [Vespula maculifrons]|uniref:Ribosomal protein L2 n=1 Tax=Vespula maculifrons TaxID=7453 RepID=A0ABD2C0Q0_VESMC
MFYGRIRSRGTTEFFGFVGSALAIRKSFLDSLERSRRIDSSSANDPRSLELFLYVALRAIAPLSFVPINAYPDKAGNRVWLCTIKNIPHSTGIKGRGNKADARIFNREKSTESIFACRGYFSLRGYPCVRNPKKSRTPYVGKRRAKEEGGSRWKVASERVDGDVPKEGYGISPEFNPYPRCRL